ncbi:MAG: hypothetical protein AXA67_12560 [Methylothermaceae bacteria B42]|nr:MAG: hypothetical protein AXA67_12560 [Methylothermaceae bacteria B42]HHJ37985.1 Uma2 family endonuclease [Methylothermaceae bacterium]
MNVAIVPKRHRITVEEFQRMGEAGIFPEDKRVELIEGEIIDMGPIGNPHASSVRKLIHTLSRQINGKALLDVQNPILLDESSEPQPDIVILRPRSDFYATHTPTAKDVLLLIEVADTSLDYDHNVKIPLYARHGIPEVWLIDLENQVIEVYRNPTPQGYTSVQAYQAGEIIQAETISGIKLNPGQLFD